MLATGAAVSTALAQVDREKIYQWINELSSPETRENALLELSKKRESVTDLAPMLWHSCGTIAALLQEIVNIYPSINPPTLTAHQSNRVCNALALLQCVASHVETRSAFLAAHIPLFLYPFLHTVSKTRPFEYLRLTSLGVIGALVKTDEQEVINFLLTTEIIPLCLRIMESGSELSKTVATFILQKILLDDTGLAYICQTYERFSHVAMILGKMVLQLSKEPSARLLKHVVRCYLRLSDNSRAREALRQCLPDQLKDTTFAQVLKDDTTTKRWLAQLVKNLQDGQDLKGKILLKGKKIGGLEESLSGVVEDSLAAEVSDEDDAAEIDEENDIVRRRPKKSKQRLSKELSDCVVYCKSVRFNSFKHSSVHSKFYEISSFTESKAKKHIKDAGAEFVHHNARQLTRVYPNGIRTDSSNFNPQEMWNAGCQIVALNVQTASTEMDLNDGLFSQNGHCGYVLKPAFMRSMEKQFDPDHPETRDGYRPVKLAVEVISGQQLPKVNLKEGSIVDPLVRLEIHGVLKDQAKQETRHIDNNGFNPVWRETLKFTIHVPELALVRFVVEDHDKTSKNDFIGQYTLPFSCIQQGYRHIHLLSKDGTSIPPSSLFVHIRIKEGT
ncbi:hypothetical protein SRHO_G00310060 [Serrasalmus rhombeus]